MKKNKLPKPGFSDYVSLLAALAATFSVIISIRSCNQAENLLDLENNKYYLEKNKYNDARALLYTSQSVDAYSFRLIPSNSNVFIQKASIVLPVALEDLYSKTIDPRDPIVSFSELQEKLNELANAKFIVGPDGKVNSVEFTAPRVYFVIDTSYIAENQSHKDRSLYSLGLMFKVNTKTYDFKTAIQVSDVNPLSFIRRLAIGEDPSDVLEIGWEKSTDKSKVHSP